MRIVGAWLSAHQRISEMADPIHFGSWGGLPSKMLWFLCGCMLTGLSITGVIIYATRLRGSWALAARGMSYWGLGAVGLIGIALWLAPKVIAG